MEIEYQDTLIEILALDNLIKTQRQILIDEDTVLDKEEKMAFYDIHDRAVELLNKKIKSLPIVYQDMVTPNLHTHGE